MRRTVLVLVGLSALGLVITTVAHRGAHRSAPATTAGVTTPTALPSTTSASTSSTSPAPATADAIHNPAGATAVALGWEAQSASLVNASVDDVLTAQSAIAADATRADQLEINRTKITQLRAAYPAGGIVQHVVVLATHTQIHDTNSVDVDVWRVSIVTYPNGQTSQDWAVVTYSMVWEHDGWHVLTEYAAPGPTPPMTNVGGFTSDAELRTRLNGFASVGASR